MDAQRRANTFKPLRQVFSFRKESKTITLTKSNPCTHVLSCSAKFLTIFYAVTFARWKDPESKFLS